MSGSEAGSNSPEIAVEADSFAEADPELRDLDAEVFPRNMVYMLIMSYLTVWSRMT
jgi:hypothetical protein